VKCSGGTGSYYVAAERGLYAGVVLLKAVKVNECKR